ncbi:MAG TPA: CRISPR-associated protein Cas4 [Arachnia sp.]|nr:CRISPR-associated protein Cas4 [Arachnia sp.]HMT86549.1 CRISPR-associated protein Cas4 [Arachnia sp.]
MDQDWLPLSIVEHHAFCPRQAALIHQDAQWMANAHTAQGEADHSAVDRAVESRRRDGTVTWTSLPVWSRQLRIGGICDVVELVDGVPRPVEHKPQWKRNNMPALQQLAAQALCLEEMFGVPVSVGIIYTKKDNRRHEVSIDANLRAATRTTVDACHRLLALVDLPVAPNDRRCQGCSLRDVCGIEWLPPRHSAFATAELGDW